MTTAHTNAGVTYSWFDGPVRPMLTFAVIILTAFAFSVRWALSVPPPSLAGGIAFIVGLVAIFAPLLLWIMPYRATLHRNELALARFPLLSRMFDLPMPAWTIDRAQIAAYRLDCSPWGTRALTLLMVDGRTVSIPDGHNTQHEEFEIFLQAFRIAAADAKIRAIPERPNVWTTASRRRLICFFLSLSFCGAPAAWLLQADRGTILNLALTAVFLAVWGVRFLRNTAE